MPKNEPNVKTLNESARSVLKQTSRPRVIVVTRAVTGTGNEIDNAHKQFDITMSLRILYKSQPDSREKIKASLVER